MPFGGRTDEGHIRTAIPATETINILNFVSTSSFLTAFAPNNTQPRIRVIVIVWYYLPRMFPMHFIIYENLIQKSKQTMKFVYRNGMTGGMMF